MFSSKHYYDPFKNVKMTGDYVANEIYDESVRDVFDVICRNLKYDNELNVSVNKSLSDKELLSKFESIAVESLDSFNEKDNGLDFDI